MLTITNAYTQRCVLGFGEKIDTRVQHSVCEKPTSVLYIFQFANRRARIKTTSLNNSKTTNIIMRPCVCVYTYISIAVVIRWVDVFIIDPLVSGKASSFNRIIKQKSLILYLRLTRVMSVLLNASIRVLLIASPFRAKRFLIE